VVELGYGGVRDFLARVVDVHQHVLALLRMVVFESYLPSAVRAPRKCPASCAIVLSDWPPSRITRVEPPLGMTIPRPLPSPGSRRPPNTAPSSLLPRLASARIHLQSDVNGREENNMATPIEEIATERRWAAVISCAALIVLAASLSRAG